MKVMVGALFGALIVGFTAASAQAAVITFGTTLFGVPDPEASGNETAFDSTDGSLSFTLSGPANAKFAWDKSGDTTGLGVKASGGGQDDLEEDETIFINAKAGYVIRINSFTMHSVEKNEQFSWAFGAGTATVVGSNVGSIFPPDPAEAVKVSPVGDLNVGSPLTIKALLSIGNVQPTSRVLLHSIDYDVSQAPTPVPIPGTLVLLGASLAGLGWAGRRKLA